MGINVHNITPNEHCIHQRERQCIAIEHRVFSMGYDIRTENSLVVPEVFGDYHTSTT